MENREDLTFEPIKDQYTEEIKSKSGGEDTTYGEIIIHPSKCVQPENYKRFAKKIRDFKVYPDDTWVITFPKCGTTWTQEMVWLLVNNLDYEKAKSTILKRRFPFME